jgi:uncharacterized protein DUF7009
MKLRIKGNSIRLRLGRSEVRRLATEGRIEESTAFGPARDQRLIYALVASRHEPGVTASLTGWRLTVRVPADVIRQWAASDQVSIHGLQAAGGEGELRILVEKDFECIDAPPEESQEDAFPHPQFAGACQPATEIERLA